jgi:ABC-type uncharacterized transport system permease subunit
MPLLWLKVATFFYGLGLVYALLLLSSKGEKLSKIAGPAVTLGMVFHLVSLAESFLMEGHFDLASVHHSESLLAFLIVAIFMIFFIRYRTTSPGIFVFPLVFLLSLSSAIAQKPPYFTSSLLRSGWIFFHVAMIFTGYAALFLSFAASLVYLVQANSLKNKQAVGFSRLPALQVIDEIGYKALILGFPFMTLGLVAGAVIAQEKFGPAYFIDPKVLLSLLMWGVYVVLLYTRWNSGWRGRKAAYLATFAFLAAIGAWAANYLSRVHRFSSL